MVSLWTSASSVGSGPSPQLARRQIVTKEWNVLSAKEQACWTRSKLNLDKEGRLTAKKKEKEKKKGR